MERSDQKHILVLITNPFSVINVIHSGLMRELGKYYRISVMSDLLTAPDIQRYNQHFQLKMHWLPMAVPIVSNSTKWLRGIQMLLFGFFFRLETIRIKLLERSRALHWLFCIAQKSRLLVFLSGSMTIFIRSWLIRRTTFPGFCASIAEYNFEALISTSPLDLRENAVANSLDTHGIPCISIIVSWDNLTSKGVINSNSGLVLVWNKQMAEEYQQYHSIFADDAAIRIAGIPRFDIYFQNPSNPSPRPRVILFSTGAVKHHSCQNYIIHDLLEYAEARADITILVRCHPGDDMRRYNCFREVKNLRFFQPFGENTNQLPPVGFLETLHLQLKACDVCVQAASTMLLDAAACDKPCISIAYDARTDMHYANSVKRFYDYSHQISLPNHWRENSVYNRDELFEKLDKIWMDNNASSDIRANMKPVYFQTAPNSVHLSTQHIREWLG